jgi:hypothetical protein
MSTADRQWALQNTEAAIGLFVAAVKSRAEVETKKLLKFLRPVSLPAIERFVAPEKFCEGKTVDGIKVAWLGENFKTNFLKRVERPIPALELREHELIEYARDPAIIIELGGEAKVETTLGQFWEFLKTADQTKWHVRHIRDDSGVLWAVDGNWDGGGLYVEAAPLGRPIDWRVGHRFLSR